MTSAGEFQRAAPPSRETVTVFRPETGVARAVLVLLKGLDLPPLFGGVL
jgi:hypothetical protein